jgi:hypothetical protein
MIATSAQQSTAPTIITGKSCLPTTISSQSDVYKDFVGKALWRNTFCIPAALEHLQKKG